MWNHSLRSGRHPRKRRQGEGQDGAGRGERSTDGIQRRDMINPLNTYNKSRLAQLVERVTSISNTNDEVSRSSRLVGIFSIPLIVILSLSTLNHRRCTQGIRVCNGLDMIREYNETA